MLEAAKIDAAKKKEPDIVRNSPEIESLVRDFEKTHKAFMDTSPKHRKILDYFKMRKKFRVDIIEAVARQNTPPKPKVEDKPVDDEVKTVEAKSNGKPVSKS